MSRNFEDLGGIGVRIVADASQIKKDFDRELTALKAQPVTIPLNIDDRGKITELRKKLSGLDVPITVKINRDTARSLKSSIQGYLTQEPVQIPIKIKPFSANEVDQIRGTIESHLENLQATVTLNWHWGASGPPPAGAGPAGGPPGPGPAPGTGPGGGGGGGGRWVWRGPGGPAPEGGPAGPARGPTVSPTPPPEEGETAGVAPAARRGGRSRFRRAEEETEQDHRARLRGMQREAEATLQGGFPTDRAGYNKAVKAYNDLISLGSRLGDDIKGLIRLPRIDEGQQPYAERLDVKGRIVRAPAILEQPAQLSEAERKARYALPKEERPPRRMEQVTLPLVSEMPARERRLARIRSGQMGVAEGVSYEPGETDAQRELREAGVKIDEETGRVTSIAEKGGEQGLRAKTIERHGQRSVDEKLLQEREDYLASLKEERTALESRLQSPTRSSRYRKVIEQIRSEEPIVAAQRKKVGETGVRGQRTQRSFLTGGAQATETQLERARTALEARGAGTGPEDLMVEVERQLDEINKIAIAAQRAPHAAFEALKKRMGGIPFGETQPRRGGRFIPKGAAQTGFLDIANQPIQLAGGEQIASPFSTAAGLLEEGKPAEAWEVARSGRTALLGAAFAGGMIPGVGKGTAKAYLDPKREGLPTSGTPEQQEQQLEWGIRMDALGAIMSDIRGTREEAARVERGKQAGTTRAFGSTGERMRDVSGEFATSGEQVRRARRATNRAPYERLAPDDPIALELRQLDEARTSFGQQIEQAKQAQQPVVDEELLEFLNRQRGGKGPSNIERLRAVADKLSAANAEEIPGILEKIYTVGKPPPGFAAIEGGLISAGLGFDTSREPMTEGREAKGRKNIAGLQSSLGRTPEEIATTYVNRPDLAEISRLEREQRRADVMFRRRAGQAASALGPMGAEEEEQLAMAAGGTIPPPSVGGGGGWEWEGEGPPPGGPPGGGGGFGGFEGPIHVIVDNWPAWLEQETAAGPMAPGMTPGAQEQALRGAQPGEASTLTAEDMADAIETAQNIVRRPDRLGSPEPTPLMRARQMVAAGVLSPEQATANLTMQREGQRFGPAGASLGQRASDIETQLAMSRQGLPIRGFATSVAQELAGGPRGSIFQRFSEAAGNLRQAEQLEGVMADLESNIANADDSYQGLIQKQRDGVELTEEQVKMYVDLPGQIDEWTNALGEAETKQKGLVDEADKWSKLTGGERFANLSKSLVGSVAGFTAYTAAIAGSSAALGLGSLALSDYIERTGGYQMATQRITNALSDQTAASGGAAQAAVAQTAAQANLTYEQYEGVKANLEDRAAVEASNKAYNEQLQIKGAERNVGAGRRGAFDQGLFQTTGGVLGTPLMGTPSTGELVGREIEAAFAPIAQVRNDMLASAAQPFNAPALVAELVGGSERMDDAFEKYTDSLGDLNERFVGTGLQFASATDKNVIATNEAVAAFTEAGFGDIARAIGRGDVNIPKGTNLDPEALATAVSIAAERNERPDPRVLLAQLEDRVLPALRAGIEKNLQNQLEIFLPAQRAIRFAAEPIAPFGRGFVPLGEGTPGGRGTQGARPDLGGVTGLTTQAAPLIGQAAPPPQTRFEGVRQSAIDSWGQYEAEASTAIKSINALAAEGERVLADKLGVPESTIAQLKGYGERIDTLRQEQADIRLDVEMSQYNRQLSMAQRTLGDLAGLTGREGGTYIGQLQRQDLLLSRRAQMLSQQTAQLGLQTQQLGLQSAEIGQQQNLMQLERAQRQVNFQQAIAGFTAPGTTPEERAARIEEAKVEANFAQREIDFNRQQLTIQQKTLAINHEQFGLQQASVALSMEQFGIQVALQDAMNNRAYQDQADTIAEMVKAAEAQDQIAARQGMIDLITTERDLFTESLQKQVEAEETFISEMTKFTVDIMEKTGIFTEEIVTQVADVFEKIRSAPSPFPSWMTGKSGDGDDDKLNYTGPGNVSPPSTSTEEGGGGGGGGGGLTTPTAGGFSGRVTSPSQFLIGEAGDEEVAILKNPRSVMLGGGGSTSGGTTVQVLVTGNTVTNEAEEDRLAQKVAALVQDILSRRTSTFGLFSSR